MALTTQPHYEALFAALRDYVTAHPDRNLELFKPALDDWGDTWQPVEPALLPVTGYLESASVDCDPAARGLLRACVEHHQQLHWEQSYRRSDRLVPESMLDGYGFAEFAGLRGPMLSDRIRAGVAIWGPRIDYPQHRHEAREAYLVLAGSMQFQFGDELPQTRRAGEVVFVDSNRVHGFHTTDESLVVGYLWQGGNLRQTSQFD